MRLYGAAIQSGYEWAKAAVRERGGGSHTVEVESILETVVDTTSDAIECAMAMATWKALGQAEDEVEFVFIDGTWRAGVRVRIENAPKPSGGEA